MEKSWREVLEEEFEKEYFKSLSEKVREAYLSEVIYPPQEFIFNAFAHCPFGNVKVVIIGQDPYHGDDQAHGLSFSVPEGVKAPPSLRNIYKEIVSDVGTEPVDNGNLERWADQGVLLLNATLTVRAGVAGSHQSLGWEEFTDAAIKQISDKKEHVVFILWGNYAKQKGKNIDRDKHLVIESAHPSPLSAHNGFFGSKPFSKTNEYLKQHNLTPIEW